MKKLMCHCGAIKAEINIPNSNTLLAWAFGEDQARYVVQVKNAEKFQTLLNEQNLQGHQIGTTTDNQILTAGLDVTISLEEVRQSYERKLPELLA